VLNWDDFSLGNGLAVGMHRYSMVSKAKHSGDKPAPTLTSPSVEKRRLDWKTEYLLFSVYCRAGLTQEATGALFGISDSIVLDIVYQWANFLNDSLSLMFPTPTRSQLLRQYPSHFIQAFGDARDFLLLDATEVWTQKSSMTTAHAVNYSDYKGHDTIKFLAGCDPIGCTFDKSLAKYGYPGSLGDSIGTAKMGILDCIPFGMRVEVDKGFLIDNLCAKLGIGCSRPPKKLKGQTQMSAEDTALTQKIGNTRIVIEQVNGGAKMQGRYFNGVIPITQLALAPLLLRVCFLMQNFRPSFIQGRCKQGNNGNASDNESETDSRPSRAEVCWYGGTDDGLEDVRGKVHLWGTKVEIRRFGELRKLHKNKDKSLEDIGKMVLQENWPAREAAQHWEYVRS